jgi:hypothetical protein
VLEFFIAFYPFSIWGEFVLVPVAVLLGILQAGAEMRAELRTFRRFSRWTLAVLGILMLWHSARGLLADPDTIFSFESLIELLLPSILTILYLPYVYCLALFLAYDGVFARLNSWSRDSDLLGFAKRRIFWRFGFNLAKLNKWSKQNPRLKLGSKDEALELINRPINPQ